MFSVRPSVRLSVEEVKEEPNRKETMRSIEERKKKKKAGSLALGVIVEKKPRLCAEYQKKVCCKKSITPCPHPQLQKKKDVRRPSKETKPLPERKKTQYEKKRRARQLHDCPAMINCCSI